MARKSLGHISPFFIVGNLRRAVFGRDDGDPVIVRHAEQGIRELLADHEPG